MTDDTLGRAIRQHVDTIAPPIALDEIVRPRSADWDDRSAARPPRDSRRRWVTMAACLLVLATTAGIALIDATPDDRSAGPADDAAPRWFAAIEPHLPPGFDHLAVLGSHRDFVNFEAFDPTTAKSLHFTVSRVPMPPDPSGRSISLQEATTTPWTDPAIEYDISLPDGRQIGVYCTLPTHNEGGCPAINRRATDPEALRAFALALATQVSVSDLPEPMRSPPHVPLASLRAAADPIVEFREGPFVEGGDWAFSFVLYSDHPTLRDFVSVRAVTGFHPAIDPSTPRASVTVGQRSLTWQAMPDGSVWFVSDVPDGALQVADDILDAAQREN